MTERRAQCAIHDKELKEVRSDMYGNGKPGLKYDYVDFKSSMSIKMTILMWLFGLQFAASMGVLIKGFVA